VRRYKTPDPHGGNTFGDRCAGALVGLLFGVPLVGVVWLWLALEMASWDVSILSFRVALWALGALSAFGFLFPRALPSLYGGLWRGLFEWWGSP
jgi:hypothetical protein